MTSGFVDSHGYSLILWSIMSSSGSISCIILLTIHITTASKKRTDNGLPQKTQKSLLYQSMKVLTLVSVIGFTLSILIGTINHYTCSVLFDRWTPVFYQCGKCCIYLGLSVRVSTLHSAWGLDNERCHRHIGIYKVVLVVMYIALAIFGAFSIQHRQQIFNGFTVCSRIYDDSYLSCSLLVDTLNMIVLLRAYTVPLVDIRRELMRKYHSKLYTYSGQDIAHRINKILILCSVATMSSFIAHVVSIWSDTYFPFLIDIPINVLCVMLMSPYYSKELYQRVCCGLIIVADSCNRCRLRHKSTDTDDDASTIESKSVPVLRQRDTTTMHDTRFNTETASKGPQPIKPYHSLSTSDLQRQYSDNERHFEETETLLHPQVQPSPFPQREMVSSPVQGNYLQLPSPNTKWGEVKTKSVSASSPTMSLRDTLSM